MVSLMIRPRIITQQIIYEVNKSENLISKHQTSMVKSRLSDNYGIFKKIGRLGDNEESE